MIGSCFGLNCALTKKLFTMTDASSPFSSGHRISLATACEWILRLSPQYRLPETTRKADQVVNLTLQLPTSI
ncbi:endonuclease V [Pseudoalteromonas sp. S16_S37]|uniref:endonuclease V n=1 Tax=Pseudoalteromonas sp. S16_S37 TaxID=2720228 RepID=UPI0019335A60